MFVPLAPLLVDNVSIPLKDHDVPLLLGHFFASDNVSLILKEYPRLCVAASVVNEPES
jgi:hypothetical protein